MLQTIREHTQGWIAGIIVTIIIVTFALWGIHSYFIGGGSDLIVAKVNGVEITKEQLAVAYERMRRQVQIQYSANSPLTTKDEAQLKERALQTLIDMQVLKQASYDQEYRISNRQVDHYLESMPEFQVDGQFSIERFQEIISSTSLSTSEFLDLIYTSLLIDQPKLGIVLTSFAMPDEINYIVSLINQERDIQFIDLPVQYFLDQKIIISPVKIRTYYEQNKDSFKTAEQVNVEYVELLLKDLRTAIHPIEIALKNFYDENINAYTQPMGWRLADIEIAVAPQASSKEIEQAQTRANEVMQAIKRGDDFAKLAQQYSKNSFKPQDWLTLNQVPSELQKAAATLTRENQVTGPIKTDKGWVILKALAVKEPKIQAFDAVKAKVTEAFVRQQAEEKFAELREKLADVAYEHPDSLQPAAKILGLTIKTSELFTKDKEGKDIAAYRKVREVAFSNDVLNLQNNSDVIQINPESVIVLRVKAHIVPALLPLSSVSRQIEDKLKTEEAEARAAKLAEEIKNKLAIGADPEKLVNSYHLVWEKTGYMGRYSTKVDSAILDTAFRLPNPATAQNKTVYGVARLPNGYAVVALKVVKEGTITDPKQYAVFAEQVQNSEGVLEYELYKLSELNKARIKVKQRD